MEPSHIVNTSSYYNEQQILKVWDFYVRTKQVHYWISDSEEENSLLTEMRLMNEAGVLIKNDGHLYLNSEGRSISICGPVDNLSIEEIVLFNGITHDLEVALKQIKIKKSKLNSSMTMNHTIIFPYHVTIVHWVLGVLD